MLYHVDILENGKIVFNYQGDIPSPLNVSYNTITDIIDFFNQDGYEIFHKAFKGSIVLNLYPKKDVEPNDYENDYLETHAVIFQKGNINLYKQ